MRSPIVFFLMLVCGAGNVFAADLQLPVYIGEAESDVRQKLGEPADAPEAFGGYMLRYPAQGLVVSFGSESNAVDGITALHARTGYSQSYSGKIISDIDVDQTIDQVVQKLGADYTSEDPSGAGQSKIYTWQLGGIFVKVEAWEIDYQEEGTMYPRGSIRSVELSK